LQYTNTILTTASNAENAYTVFICVLIFRL